MNIQITQTKCNACGGIIPAAGTNGAVRLPQTQIDFCAECAAKTVLAVAATFTMPLPPPPTPMKKVKLANGQTVNMPAGAPLPQGAQVVPN